MLDAFQCKMDEAANEEVRQRLRLVMDTAMAEMACAVYQRNSMMLGACASPLAGDHAYERDDGDGDVRPEDVVMSEA